MTSLSIKNRIIALLAVLLLIGGGLQAQKPREKVEAMRIAFITNRLDLSPEEAKLFWPIYNNYRHDLTTLRRNFFPMDDGTDPHLDAERQLDFEQKKLDLKKKYTVQFAQVIGKEKVNKLVSAEEDFKRLLMQTIRNRRQQGPRR